MTQAEPAPPDASGGQPPRPRLVFLAVGVVLAAALGVGLFTSLGTSKNGIPAVGGSAPSFALSELGGTGTVGTPADGGGGGKPAVLIFFASWCGPCHAEIPAIAAAYRAQKSGSRIQIIGVDGMDPTKAALAFVHNDGVTFPVAADPTYQVTQGLYAFTGDPDAVFVDSDGTIRHIVHGPITRSELVTWERRLT